MRTIKFRGLDLNGNWHYGNLTVLTTDAHSHHKKGSYISNSVGMPFAYAIRPETVGQFTGLKDKNGKEIYEGDVVGEEGVYHFIEREGWKPSSGNWKIIGEKTKNFTGKGDEKYISGYELKVVEWKDTSCGFEPFSDSEENCGHCGGGRDSKRFEVIGNIYENPDLI